MKEGMDMKNTSVSLGDYFTSFIDAQVRAGRYGSTSEVVRAGLRLLEEHDLKLKALQDAFIAGEELHRYRVALMEHFKTLEAVMEYIHSEPTAEEFPAQLDAGEKQKQPKAANRRRVKPAAKPRGQRKTGKRPAHA